MSDLASLPIPAAIIIGAFIIVMMMPSIPSLQVLVDHTGRIATALEKIVDELRKHK